MPLQGQLFGGEASQNAPRRNASTGYNQTAELCRHNLAAAFEAADRDKNHTVTRKELATVLQGELAITLQSPHDDLDTIFDTMVNPYPPALEPNTLYPHSSLFNPQPSTLKPQFLTLNPQPKPG